MNAYQWPIASRIAWLDGGIVATNAPQDEIVQIKTNLFGHDLRREKITEYHQLCPLLNDIGFDLVGMTYVTSDAQATGRQAPDFFLAGDYCDWPNLRVMQA